MDELEVFASLLTPASDLVLGSIAPAELGFGRAGNDTLRVYSPQATELQSQNVDFLFGDVFDNTEQEIGLIFGIQDGSNPLGILETGPPSIGEDRFILGDANGPYYVDEFSGFSLSTTDLFGLNDYSVIYDFNPAQDTIELSGSPNDYLLVELNGVQSPAISQPFFGEAVFLRQGSRLDLVTYIVSTPELDLSLSDDYFEFVDGVSDAALPQVGQIGTPSIDISYGSATDSAGNLYLTGATRGSLAGSQGGNDVWVAKFDRQGNELWTRQFGSASGDAAYGIVTDDDGNFYLSGETGGNLFEPLESSDSDAWVAKFDSDGNQIWGNQFGISDAFASASYDLDLDDAGNVYLSGFGIKDNTNNLETFNFSVQDDIFITKFDSNGNQQWLTELGSPVFDESYGVAVDGEGNVYATGWTQGLVRPADPSRTVSIYDYWLTKLDTNGQVQFTEQFSSSNDGLEFAWDVETDSQGNAYVTGWTTSDLGGPNAGSYDPWLAKFNPDGSQEWSRQFGTSGDDGSYIASFDIDSSDNIYVTGYTNSGLGGNNVGYDTWVVKYDSAGNQQWSRQLSSTNLDYGTDVTVNDFGELFVTGFTNGSLGAENVGAEDAWVAKLNANSGNLESFASDLTGTPGQVGTENDDDDDDDDDDDQISQAGLLESLTEVFGPNAVDAFTDVFGEALSENAGELDFEDEIGDELDEEDIEEFEGIDDDDGDRGRGRNDDDDDDEDDDDDDED